MSKLSKNQLALIQEISTHDFIFYDALFFIRTLLRTACFEQSVCFYIHNYVVHSSFGCFQDDVQDKFTYSGWWSVWWTGTYSMILSKAAFFHKKYLSMYTYDMPSSIREYVSKNRFFLIWYLHSYYLVLHSFSRSISFSQLSNIFLNTIRTPGIVKILLCLSLSLMQLVPLLFGWKVSTFSPLEDFKFFALLLRLFFLLFFSVLV